MDIINELNLRSCRTYFQKAGKSEHTRSVNSGQCHFQYRLKLLKTKKTIDGETAMVSISGLQAMIAFRTFAKEYVEVSKILIDRVLAWQETKA